MTSYSRNYYQQNRTRLQENQRKYEYEKYNSDKQHKLFKRYQSRIDNHFKPDKHKAEELLSCSKAFFTMYVEFCLRDTNRATMDLSLIDLHHIIPVITDPTNLDLWHWTNIMPVTEEENLKQSKNRDKEAEKIHKNRVLRFLHTVQIN
jgi:hypothetical protein